MGTLLTGSQVMVPFLRFWTRYPTIRELPLFWGAFQDIVMVSLLALTISGGSGAPGVARKRSRFHYQQVYFHCKMIKCSMAFSFPFPQGIRADVFWKPGWDLRLWILSPTQREFSMDLCSSILFSLTTWGHHKWQFHCQPTEWGIPFLHGKIKTASFLLLMVKIKNRIDFLSPLLKHSKCRSSRDHEENVERWKLGTEHCFLSSTTFMLMAKLL